MTDIDDFENIEDTECIEIQIAHWASFGKGDSSDAEYEDAVLCGEDAELYLAAKRKRIPLEEVEGLQHILDEYYEEIEEAEIERLIDFEDEDVLRMQGLAEVDPDEINSLVKARDPNALRYFDLTELSDEELAKWDAHDLAELPQLDDFYPDFEAESPFDNGWTLHVEFAVDEDEYYYDEDFQYDEDAPYPDDYEAE